jgi:hypothetical protein
VEREEEIKLELEDPTAFEFSGMNRLATLRVNPSRNIPRQQSNVPETMKGRRRPQRESELSASEPTSGWTINPESGPATNTKDITAGERPRLRR